MVQVRYNTNYGVLPDQKRWRVLIDGGQVFTNSVDIRTKSWTTKDFITGEDGNPIEKYHVTCKPEIVKTNEDGIELKNYDDMKVQEEPHPDLVCVKWSESLHKWKVNIKGEDRLFDEIFFKTDVWTSDISPELCCRPIHIGISETTVNKILYLSDTF
jgi:hypothetical protein